MFHGLLKKENIKLNLKEEEYYDKHKIMIMNYYSILNTIFFGNLNLLNDKNKKYFTKMNYYDLLNILYYKSCFGITYDEVIDTIYEKFNVNISAKTLRKRFKMIDISHLSDSNIKLLDYFYTFCGKEKRILSCDGTTISVDNNLKKENYKSVSTDSYCKAYLSTIYDSTNKIPIAFCINKNKNERKDALDLINNVNKNDIIIFDRGYPSYQFMKKLNDREIKYIIRSKDNIDAVDDIEKNNKKEEIYEKDSSLYKGTPFRIIKCLIKDPYDLDSNYYLITNIFDIEYKVFNDLYFKRWQVEIFYDKLKNYAHGDYYNVKSEEELNKTIYVQFNSLIITRIIIEMIKKIFGEQKEHKIINFKSAFRITLKLII